jgi:phage terminase large subunit-like protein
MLAGRGVGKTRSGAEKVRSWAESGDYSRIALVAATAADARDVMVEGESGLLACCPPWNRPKYEPSKRRVVWPNGALATLYSADEPERLRGPQSAAGWCDELAAWRFLEQAWDNLIFGLRLGDKPRLVITTTPKPLELLRKLIKDPTCIVTRGNTFENAANLAPTALAEFRAKYEGTRIGRQELYAEMLDDTPGALWTLTQLDNLRVQGYPDLVRIVVAIDPAVSVTDESDETGIVVAGLGIDGHGYVLEDLTCKTSPQDWAQRAANAFYKWRADRIVAEVNNGGDLVLFTLQASDGTLPVKKLHASRGKIARAEPIAALYEQGRVHHVGSLITNVREHKSDLEEQMCSYAPGSMARSPDRMDALVWALTELFLEDENVVMVYDDRVEISEY